LNALRFALIRANGRCLPFDRARGRDAGSRRLSGQIHSGKTKEISGTGHAGFDDQALSKLLSQTYMRLYWRRRI
jgi:hypothetical protein